MVKKKAQEKLQELRHKDHSDVKYKKRIQQQQEEDKYMKEELKKLNDPQQI